MTAMCFSGYNTHIHTLWDLLKQLIRSFWVDSSDPLKEKGKVKAKNKLTQLSNFLSTVRESLSVCNVYWDGLGMSQPGISWWNRRDAWECLQNVKVGHMALCKPEGTWCTSSSAGLEWDAESHTRLTQTSFYRRSNGISLYLYIGAFTLIK